MTNITPGNTVQTSNNSDSSDNTHNLKIGHCNIQGGFTGIAKSTQVSQIINNYSLDILSLNETNLNDTIDTDSLNIPPNFTFLRSDRGIGTRGGCGILISNTCAFEPFKIDTNLSHIEAKWIKLKHSKIHVCGFYRSNGYCKVDNFIDYMAECMNKLKGKKVIWIGDINIDQNKINDPEYKKLDSTLKSFSMVQIIQNYTRIAKKGNTFTYSTIDVIITNCYSDYVSSSVLTEKPGDHYAINCELSFKVEKPEKFEKFSFHNYSNNNIKTFQTYLANSDLSNILNSNDVEEAANILNDKINSHHDDFFPLKTAKKHIKYIYKPSQESLDAIRLKKKLYRKFKAKIKKVIASHCDKCGVCNKCISASTAWSEYKVQRNLTTKLTKTNKKENVVNELKAKSSKNDLKGVWQTIKLAANLPTKSNTINSPPNDNIDASSLNEHFCTIGPKLKDSIPIYTGISYKDFMANKPNDCSINSFMPVTSNAIESYIKSLSSDKAITDNIPLKIFKAITPIILPCLAHIVNLSLSSGKVPNILKIANVTPIHKGDDPNDPNNYRPISILPIVSKCIEHCVSEQVTGYFENNHLLTSKQYGFSSSEF